MNLVTERVRLGVDVWRSSVVFVVIYGFVVSCRNEIIYALSWGTVYALTLMLSLCLSSKLILSWVHRQLAARIIHRLPCICIYIYIYSIVRIDNIIARREICNTIFQMIYSGDPSYPVFNYTIRQFFWVSLQLKYPLSRYRDFHYNDKMVMSGSYLYFQNTYTVKIIHIESAPRAEIGTSRDNYIRFDSIWNCSYPDSLRYQVINDHIIYYTGQQSSCFHHEEFPLPGFSQYRLGIKINQIYCLYFHRYK